MHLYLLPSHIGTTLNIKDDALQAAKELAAREKKVIGQVIFHRLRKGVHVPAPNIRARTRPQPESATRFVLSSVRGR
jgi:hypothetical protein